MRAMRVEAASCARSARRMAAIRPRTAGRTLGASSHTGESATLPTDFVRALPPLCMAPSGRTQGPCSAASGDRARLCACVVKDFWTRFQVSGSDGSAYSSRAFQSAIAHGHTRQLPSALRPSPRSGGRTPKEPAHEHLEDVRHRRRRRSRGKRRDADAGERSRLPQRRFTEEKMR